MLGIVQSTAINTKPSSLNLRFISWRWLYSTVYTERKGMLNVNLFIIWLILSSSAFHKIFIKVCKFYNNCLLLLFPNRNVKRVAETWKPVDTTPHWGKRITTHGRSLCFKLRTLVNVCWHVTKANKMNSIGWIQFNSTEEPLPWNFPRRL